MHEEGADIIDIGAESSRPGAGTIDEAEELRRLIPVLGAVHAAVPLPISVDTTKAAVARRAIQLGASIVNDISALRGDPLMATVAADTGAAVVLMHMQGTPRTMQQAPHYDDVVEEVSAFFEERIRFATAHGIVRRQIILDPGIGFGKLLAHNLTLLAQLRRFCSLNVPCWSVSRRKGSLGSSWIVRFRNVSGVRPAAVAMAVDRGAGSFVSTM